MLMGSVFLVRSKYFVRKTNIFFSFLENRDISVEESKFIKRCLNYGITSHIFSQVPWIPIQFCRPVKAYLLEWELKQSLGAEGSLLAVITVIQEHREDLLTPSVLP
jgi:hypothetical protein